MAFDFPNAPVVGQTAYAYTWDGQKWTTTPGKTPVYTDGSTPMTAQLTLVGDPVNPTDAADKHYVDTTRMAVAGGQNITGGFSVQTYAIPAGSFTLNPLNGNYQFYSNTGAFPITAPSVDCAVDIIVINGASAGAITFSGFIVGSAGDPLTTTNGSRFIISIRRMAGVPTYAIKALQ